MGTTTKKPEEMTWADIRATFAEAAALSKENDQGLKELKATVAKTSETVDRMAAERKESLAKLEATVNRTSEAVRELTGEVKGIANSNGMMAEDYFFESLNKTKTLGGMHFDIVKRNMSAAVKIEDGKTLDEEYDTVMINDTAICVVEVKYKVDKHDVNRLAKKRVHNFKKLFPMYADYKIYLAFGGLTFQKGAVDTAKELGMGVLRLKGNAVEVYDKDLKAY